MTKYFVVSDIHSCYSALVNSLDKKGYDKNNSSHILIVCGDIFDRGYESVEVYEFLKSIPKENRILIRGNHEYLFKELCNKSYPEKHDFSNGTVRTLTHFMNVDEELNEKYNIKQFNEDLLRYDFNYVKDSKKLKEIIDWIDSDDWVNFYELDKYIFVHSFIVLGDKSYYPGWYEYGHYYYYREDWREETRDIIWSDFSWPCPFKLIDKGLFDEELAKGKILVYGHWYSCYVRDHYQGRSETLNHSIYRDDKQIAIDSCTPITDSVNVLIIDGDTFEVDEESFK